MPEPTTTAALIRAGLTGAKLAGVDIPGISDIFGGGFGKHTSSADRQARLMAAFRTTANAKVAFDQDRIIKMMPPGATALASGQDIIKFKQRDDIFEQPWTWIITKGGGGLFDIANRTPQELVKNMQQVNLGEPGGFFIQSAKGARDASESIFKWLTQFSPEKAESFRTELIKSANTPGGVNFEPASPETFIPSFLDASQLRKSPSFVGKPAPQKKSPIEFRDLARLALNFIPKGKAPRLRAGQAGGFTFAEQAKEQDLIIPPGFTMKQPTTLSRAIDPNILRSVV